MLTKNTNTKLSELAKRAKLVKADPNLRHAPNKHDILKASENTCIMQVYQYQTINIESSDV